MKRLLALSSLTLALGCASTTPEGVVGQRDAAGNVHAYAHHEGAAISHYDATVAVIETRRSSLLQDRLARCGRNQDCRADTIARYHQALMPPRTTM
jgi:hypothetical protein